MVPAHIQRAFNPIKQLKSSWFSPFRGGFTSANGDMLRARSQFAQARPVQPFQRVFGTSSKQAQSLTYDQIKRPTYWPAMTMALPQSVPTKPRPPASPNAQPLLAKWCTQSTSKPPPTAVLVHGILGNKRNLKSFTRMLLQEHPAWQVLLVDLRSHGDSPSATLENVLGPSSVDSAAADVLHLLRHLRIFPNTLVGHSFGGKVVLSMTEQFGPRLPRPVSVWVLDTIPGTIGAPPAATHGDHPRNLIRTLRALPLPISTRSALIQRLLAEGFSDPIARWVATNLRPAPGAAGGDGSLVWAFDLDGIASMYESYEHKSHWPLLQAPPQGLSVHFVRAEHSSFRWSGGDAERITALGHAVHLLRDAGHWVHTDNPRGLLDIMALAFGHRDDVRAIQQSYAQAGAAA